MTDNINYDYSSLVNQQGEDQSSNNNTKIEERNYSSNENLKVEEMDQKKLLMGQISFRTSWVRWIALVCACLLMVGNYMSYDFPSYLQTGMGITIFNCSNYDAKTENCKEYRKYYPLLYSLYSFPNFILPLFGGFFIDKIGVRLGLILFTGILTIGQLICTLAGVFEGGWNDNTSVFVWLYIGRVIFALGGENQTVTQSTIVSKWFQGKELAFALGTNISCARLGSFVGSQILPRAYKSHNLTFALLIAEIFCMCSFLFMLVLVWMDKKADQQEGKNKVSDKLDPSEQVNLKDIKDFPLLYWLLAISCLLNYQCIFVFLQFAQGFFTTEFQDGETQASTFQSIPYLISAFLTPFVGLLADKIGQRQWLLLLSSSIMVTAHILFLALPHCPAPEEKCSVVYQIIPLVLMGLFYSFYAAILWPCIPLVLKEQYVGTGFGVATAIQNFGLFLAPLVVNQIIPAYGYTGSQIYFIGSGVICIFISFFIIYLDKRTGKRLAKITGKEGDLKKSRASMAHL